MPTQRIPLSQPIETRNGLLNTDSKCVNGYFETRNNIREFVKRPGVATHTVTPAIPAEQGQGIYLFKGNLYAVVNNVLYKIDPTTYASTVVGTITGAIAQCYFVETLDSTYLFFHNQTNGYIINGSTGAFSQVKNDNIAVTTILTGGSGYTAPTVTFSAPSGGGTTATGTVQLTSGIVTGITITNGGSGYTSSDTLVVTINDPTGMGATATALLNAFPTGPFTPGVVFLDSYIVIATVAGRLYNCELANPNLWNALNYVSAESEPDNLTGIAKHLNYILGLGQWSTDFFYDNGNYPGSPLSAAPSYKFEVGCANGNSIVSFENTVLFVGISKTTGTGVYGIDGVAPVKISTAFIDRILNNSNMQDVTAYTIRFNGHPLYILTLGDLNVTIVYDVSEKMWHQWTMWAKGDATSGVPGIYGEQYFRPSYFAGDGLTYYLLDDDNGTLYTLADTNYNDAGAPIYYRCVTDLVDNGITKRKFYNRVEIIGDKVAATMNIRHTDNDYESWSPYRGVNLNASRAQIYQTGAARRRAWEFLCTDNVPLRLDAAEIDFEVGELEGGGPAPTNYRR